jgi:hypothetical protein
MRIGELVMIIATILGPVLAVQAQKWIERWRSKKDRKIEIFTKLMTSRAAPLSVQHVEALNQIDLEFHGDKKYKKVIDAWKALHDHLHQHPEGESQKVVWATKKNDLLVELLMSWGNLWTMNSIKST